MNRVMLWFTGIVGSALDPEERDAARGDLAESGATARRVLLEIAGLAARRQAVLWKSWRPWVALAGLLPIYLALTSVAPSVTQFLARYSWTGDSNPRWAIQTVGAVTLTALYSGVIGFVLASLSRRAVFVNGAVFATMAIVAVFSQPIPPTGLRGLCTTLIFQAFLLFLPFFRGMWYGVLNDRPALWPALLLTATGVLMLGCVSSDWKEVTFLLLFLNWPFGYLILRAKRPLLK